MSKELLKHIDDEGYAWTVLVEDGMSPKYGVVYGPYDLERVVSDVEDRKKLQEALVDAGLYNAPSLLNRRVELRRLVVELGLPVITERKIVSVFQQAYYRKEE